LEASCGKGRLPSIATSHELLATLFRGDIKRSCGGKVALCHAASRCAGLEAAFPRPLSNEQECHLPPPTSGGVS